jgi:hypothetical protein
MTVDEIVTNLQENCNKYITENSENIIKSIEQNIVPITIPFPEFKLKELGKKSWGVYIFYITSHNEISTFGDLNNLWQTSLSDKKLHSPKAINGRF